MKSQFFLKLLLLPCTALLWSSCLLPEDVVSSGEFQPLKMLSISPDSAKVGDAIVITGENFISKKEFNHVWFSPGVKAEIDSATKTQLFLKVPDGAVTGDVVVSNGGFADTVRSGFKILADPDTPNNIKFTPEVAYVGTRVFVTGNNFDEPSTALVSGIKTQIYKYLNKLSFIVPEGAKSGKVIITNQNGKSGTSEADLKINTEDQKLSAFLTGIRIIKKKAYTTNSPFETTFSFDTLNSSSNFQVIRTMIPDKGTFYNIGFCFADQGSLPFVDSVLQSFIWGSNYSKPYTYTAIHLSIDSTANVLTFLKISRFFYSDDIANNSWEYSTRDCNTLEIGFDKIPFKIVDGKKIVRLNSEEIKKHLTLYKSTEEHDRFKSQGGYMGNSQTDITVYGIHEILPDAYFELTLE